MSTHTRRAFLSTSAALAASTLLPWPLRAATRRRLDPPATYFSLSEAGLELDRPIAGLTRRIRVLTGSLGESSNSLVYCDERGSMLVDVATSPFGRRMVEDALAVGGPFGDRAEGSGLDAIVVNTHHHMDHTGGNFALADFGPRPMVAMHAVAEQRVRSSIERYRQNATSALRGPEALPEGPRRDMAVASARSFIERAATLSPDDFGPTRTFNEERYELPCGTTTVVLHHFGAGHTDNDTVVQFPDDNVIHCGDLLFSRMHPYFAADSNATTQGWINSNRRMLELCDDATVLVPGHGPVCDAAELRRQLSYLEQLWDAVSAEVARGTTREAAVAMTWDFMAGLERPELSQRAIGSTYDEIVAAQ